MGFVSLISNTQPESTVHGNGDFKIKQELRIHLHPIYKPVFIPICTASFKVSRFGLLWGFFSQISN